MTEEFPLPPDLEQIERELAARPRSWPDAGLKERCVQQLRVELRGPGSGSRWSLVAATAAALLVGLNLSLSATQATDFGLHIGSQQQSVQRAAEEIRQLLPDVPPKEAARQAVLLRAGADIVLCPKVSTKYVASGKNFGESISEY
jgi:hypothetical protein